jgi:hypothetical protein
MAPAVGFAGLFEAAACNVEEPPVIATADAPILDTAAVKRRPAMHAARIEQTRPAGTVAKEHEVLAEHAHRARQIA